MASPALITPEDIERELALTAGYDVNSDVDQAKRRVIALRRKLDLPMSAANESQESVTLAMQTIENQLQQVLNWLAVNNTQSAAQRLNNPSVVHADFSTFRGYAGNCS